MEPTVLSKPVSWCVSDKHHHYESFLDFNEWFDNDEGQFLREKYGVDGLSSPSKAFFAGDRQGYNQAFKEYRENELESWIDKIMHGLYNATRVRC